MLKDNLIRLRKERGYSQEEIAGLTGVSRQTYAKWEKGQTVPDVQKVWLISGIYGVTMESLVYSHDCSED
ncbi:MAG: helix-turn-helix transcriptional regulator [Anaerovoracaceae bacterium]|nr:helix-turn-helix transcriptional regulator [Bacillota bacterium]MDY5975097.1 helix-turn-helix transcriptional regulator [Anaerovoracaceae bacterium]